MPDHGTPAPASGTPLAEAFLAAADSVVAIVSRPDVAAAWESPSALPEWSVGGLTAHLAGQVPTALRLLRAEPGPEPITLDEHYARAAWVRADVDDAVNVDIRSAGDAQAADGPQAVLDAVLAARAELPTVLAAAPSSRAVLIPWQGWSLAVDDFLTSRMMEVVVHGEDVAASVGFAAPPLPGSVLGPVFALLTRLAVQRHGQGAVVSALSRSERAPRTISAF